MKIKRRAILIATAALWTVISLGTLRAQIPSSLGWYQIPNTQMASVTYTLAQAQALGIYGFEGPAAVINDWSSGIADTKRNRLVFTGGGHAGYGGNELYALDLNSLQMLRLNDSDPGNACSSASVQDTTGEIQGAGNPNSRHTYGGLAYIPTLDKMYLSHGGLFSFAAQPCTSIATWLLDLSTLTWTRKDPLNGTAESHTCCNYQITSAYDPNTDAVYYFDDDMRFFKYDPNTNTRTLLNAISDGLSHAPTAVVDHMDKLFIAFSANSGSGSKIWQADLSQPTPQLTDITPQTSGCTASVLMTGKGYPGLAFDPTQHKVVGWNGGGSVVLYDPVTKTCTTQTFAGGPGVPNSNGTFGRWQYFPAPGVFALVNDWQQNAWVLRMTPAGPPDTTPPTVGITTPANGATVSGTITIAGTAADNVSVASVQVSVDGGPFSAASGTANWTFSLNTTSLTNASHTISAKATDTSGNVSAVAFIGVTASNSAPAPIITSALTASGTVGSVFSYQITASNSPAGFNATGLPAGLSVNTSNGLISGTPTAAGTFSVTISATNSGGTGSATLALTIASSGGGVTPEQDFANRCGAPGVLKCVGWDNASDFVPPPNNTGLEDGIHPASDGSYSRIIQDTGVKVSGAGALKLVIPPSTTPGFSFSANSAGFWSTQFPHFGPHTTMYMQYRLRVDSNMLNFNWSSISSTGWKVSDIFGNLSCASNEITQENTYQRNIITGYTHCSSPTLTDNTNPADPLLEQGDYLCHYQAQPYSTNPNCFKYAADAWITEYWVIQFGDWGVANSYVQLWAAPLGQPLKRVIDLPNFTLNAQGSPTDYFGTVYLFNYTNGAQAGAAEPGGTMWFDELIVSNQPIAAPNGSAPPADTTPPTVAITSPTNGAMVSGTITVAGTAADNAAVASVQVSVDGGAFSTASGTSNWTFSLNTASLSNASHTISAKATDTSGNVSTIASISVTVNNSAPPPSVPVITSALTASGTVGSAFSYQITAGNNPTSFNVTGLPGGLSVNTSNGLISGTPTAAGSSNVTISATNAGGTGSATLALTVNNPAPNAPVITSAGTATGTVGAAFSYQITATNSPTSFNATGLPAGLSVNTSNGLISGAPTAPGSFNVSISAANAGGTGATNAVFTINPRAPVINSPTTAAGTAGIVFSYQITAANGPTSFNATGLPVGLSVNTSNGLISGTPTTAGTSSVTLSATNSGGTGTATLTLTINTAVPPTVSLVPLSTTTVSGTVTLTASASSNLGIASVQFQLDGSNLGSSVAAPPFTLSWNTAQAAPGTHSLTAIATDTSGNKTTSAPVTVTVVRGADATPGLRQALVYPNPAVKSDPTIRAFLGVVNSVEITIFDASGRVVNSASLPGAPTGTSNNQFYYDYTWTGRKASGIYFAVIHGKATDGSIIRARVRFAVVM